MTIKKTLIKIKIVAKMVQIWEISLLRMADINKSTSTLDLIC